VHLGKTCHGPGIGPGERDPLQPDQTAHFGEGPVGQNPAVVNDDDALSKCLDLLEIVTGQQHGAPLLVVLPDALPQGAAGLHV